MLSNRAHVPPDQMGIISGKLVLFLVVKNGEDRQWKCFCDARIPIPTRQTANMTRYRPHGQLGMGMKGQ